MKRFLILYLFWLVSSQVSAFQLSYWDTLIITEPIYHNLYLAGKNVVINAPVHGDLVVTGGTVTVNDSVTSDILCIGGNLKFNGYVGSDIRCAGGSIEIEKNVEGDVVVIGSNLYVSRGSSIGRLMTASSKVTIDGTVLGSTKVRSGNMILNGTLMQNLDFKGGIITVNGPVRGPAMLGAGEKIVIGELASFDNNVNYWTPQKNTDFKHSLKGGPAIYDAGLRQERSRWYFLGLASFVMAIWYIGMIFLLIMIVQYLFARTMKKAGETIYTRPLKSIGWGILYWIGIPVVALLAICTLVGLPVGFLLLAGYTFLLLLSFVIASVVLANWLNGGSQSGWSYWKLVGVASVIFMVLKILSLTPFIGLFICGIIICASFGAIVINIHFKRYITPQKV